jgi:hypothetical protein
VSRKFKIFQEKIRETDQEGIKPRFSCIGFARVYADSLPGEDIFSHPSIIRTVIPNKITELKEPEVCKKGEACIKQRKEPGSIFLQDFHLNIS